ncbi:MAG: heme ABC exporter ATP-binding protein CcmA [Anaerolineae bacterium]|nr:heme ABC exporter ATP-binding protein CcmA [Anaerolineae bacterium]
MTLIIETCHLTKAFGPWAALSNVDFEVPAGQFVMLVGPNGAGKTTLLRILATLARPTSGTVRIAGLDPVGDGIEARRRIGFLSHRTILYDDLTAEQNLRFYARMYDLEDADARIDALLERVGLTARRHSLVHTFSRGMQQRLAVARTVLHAPDVLLLDEPYTGLDPTAAQVLSDLLTELAGEGCTVVMTTHDLERGLAVGHRVVVLARGRIVYDAHRNQVDPGTFFDTYRALTT